MTIFDPFPECFGTLKFQCGCPQWKPAEETIWKMQGGVLGDKKKIQIPKEKLRPGEHMARFRFPNPLVAVVPAYLGTEALVQWKLVHNLLGSEGPQINGEPAQRHNQMISLASFLSPPPAHRPDQIHPGGPRASFGRVLRGDLLPSTPCP